MPYKSLTTLDFGSALEGCLAWCGKQGGQVSYRGSGVEIKWFPLPSLKIFMGKLMESWYISIWKCSKFAVQIIINTLIKIITIITPRLTWQE